MRLGMAAMLLIWLALPMTLAEDITLSTPWTLRQVALTADQPPAVFTLTLPSYDSKFVIVKANATLSDLDLTLDNGGQILTGKADPNQPFQTIVFGSNATNLCSPGIDCQFIIRMSSVQPNVTRC